MVTTFLETDRDLRCRGGGAEEQSREMSCINVVDGIAGGKNGNRRSSWFYNSLQHLQQWQGWNHFKQRSRVKYHSGVSLHAPPLDDATWRPARNPTCTVDIR